jgi:hypothetical protein
MVAVIKTGCSLRHLLNYNEQKVSSGAAVLLTAENYPIDGNRLQFSQKLNRLVRLAALNKNVKANSVHISLNFHPSEVLSDERMQVLAREYMDGIGFGDQPYLVYRHWDAAHPHIHLVSVKVEPNGKRIKTHDIVMKMSGKMCGMLEKKYGLVRADECDGQQRLWLKPSAPSQVVYGKTETKRAMANVLLMVLHDYRFASLPELNAILKCYNILADRGNENSRIFKNNGLVYRALDAKGKRVGSPIKASDFYFNPGLKLLEGKFTGCVKLESSRKRLQQHIDWALLQGKRSLNDLIKALKKEGITVSVCQNPDSVICGLTYVDHMDKVVFTDSDLGKGYSARLITERYSGGTLEKPDIELTQRQGSYEEKAGWGLNIQGKEEGTGGNSGLLNGKPWVEAFLETENTQERMDWELKRKRRKKKKVRLN